MVCGWLVEKIFKSSETFSPAESKVSKWKPKPSQPDIIHLRLNWGGNCAAFFKEPSYRKMGPVMEQPSDRAKMGSRMGGNCFTPAMTELLMGPLRNAPSGTGVS